MLLAGTAFSMTITEIHYNPPTRDGDCEFVELYNESCTVADLSGFRFARGLHYVFPDGTRLNPGGYLVLAVNAAAFKARYGFDPDGVYTGRLDSGGEALTLENDAWSTDASGGDLDSGCRVIDLTYNDRGKWPSACDGTGHSLCLRDPFLDAGDADNWAPSPALGGTPRAANGLGSPTSQTTTLIAEASANWRYRPGSSAFPTNWAARTYNDGAWSSGQAGFGYADADDNTTLEMRNNYTSVCIRKSFTVASPAALRALTLGVWYDDGFVAYINGTEVARKFVTDTPPTATTVATTSHEASAWESFDLSASLGLLVQGANVLAIAGFNQGADSSDFSLDARLSGALAAAASEVFPVVISECLYSGFGRRFLELYNRGASDVDLGGYYLTDDGNVLDRMRIPDGTVVPAGVFLTLYEDQLNFALLVDTSTTGAPMLRIFLVAPDLSRVLAARAFDADVQEGHSRGRWPAGSDDWWECATPTPGAVNQVTVETNLVINEIMYHPTVLDDPYDPNDGDADDLEYIELYNRGSNPISLAGMHFDEGVEFFFQANVTLAAGKSLVVARNPTRMREVYGTIANLYGPYAGKLADGGERVRLLDALGNTVDSVRYYDGGRWPRWADGEGSSLELVDARQDNSLCTAWDASRNEGQWAEIIYTGTHRSVIDNAVGENEFALCLMGAGEVLVDEVFMGDSLAAANKITNSSFDGDTTGWVIQGTHRDSVRVTGDTAAGTGALKIVASGRGDNRCNRIECNTLSLTPAATYYVRYQAKWLRGSNMLMTRTHRHGVVKTSAIPVPAQLGTPGAANSVARGNVGPALDRLEQTPALPKSTEQVTITVRAHDADDIRTIELKHRADGGTFAAAAMYDDGAHGDGTAGDGTYGGVVPAYPANTIVQFYVEATDNSAARLKSTFPIQGAAKPWVWIVRDTNPSGGRQRYQVAMSSADYGMLSGNAGRGEAMSNYLWPASFVANGAAIHHGVGVRYRGSPWIRPGNPEAGYRFRFSRDKLLYGLHYEINLDRNDNDGTRQKDRTASYFMRKLGAPDPYVKVPYNRGEYIALRFNLSDEGGYEQIQKIDGDYLEYWWRGDDKGNLFKADDWFEAFNDGNPQKILTANLTYRGENKEAYRWFFGLRTNEELDDYGPLITLCRSLQQYSGAELDTVASNLMDVREWAGVLCVRYFIGDWDTLGFDRGKNAFLYFAPEGRAKLVPWDSDLTFQSGYVGAKLYPEAGGGDAYFPNMAKLFQRPWARRLMNQNYAYLIGSDGPANRANLDWLLDANVSQAGLPSANEIKNFVTSRASTVRGVLTTVAFAITTPGGGADFTGTSSPVVIGGKAPSEVDRILVNSRDETPYVRWTALDTWELTLPLAPGAVTYAFSALNRDGRQIGSDSIRVTFGGDAGPRITGFRPMQGRTTGGYEIAVQATDYVEPVELSIGGKVCASSRVEGGLVRAIVPSGAGFATVSLRSGNGLSAAAAERFWYVTPAPPSATGFTPTHGPAAGGTEVTIFGSNFGEGARVYFSDREALPVTFISKQELRAVTPAAASGIMRVRVKVISAEGLASTISTPNFEYDPGPPPALTSISPTQGSTSGGTEVTIAGNNFAADPAAMTVTFGGVDGDVVAATVTSLTVLAPPHNSGVVSVQVANPDGTSAQLVNAFTYTSLPPVVEALWPECGPFAGGNEVTIDGQGFATESVSVLFGSVPADIVSATPHQLIVLAPAGTGSVAVAVFNPDGLSASAPSSYTYASSCNPVVDRIDPASGPEAGNTLVTIYGRNLVANPDRTQVMFGMGAAQVLAGGTSTEVMVVTPEGTGRVDLIFTNPDGSFALVRGAFTYEGEVPPDPYFLRGDANRDSHRDVADAIKILGYLFASDTLSCLDAADVNDDGKIDIADAIRLLGVLFGGGGSLPPPYDAAGPDSTTDQLNCAQ